MGITYDDTTNETAEYAAFIEKFKPKKTTDDCYTPPNIYEAVRFWATEEYGLHGRQVVRPFYPGGDYESFDYPEGCVVIDNPPFSCLSQICDFYDKGGIDYFLFAPGLTLFSTNRGRSNYIITGTGIVYENGANVDTGFVTNMGTDRIVLAPDLSEWIKAENEKNSKSENTVPKYEYPDYVVSSATLSKIVKRGISMRLPRSAVQFIRAMDHQRDCRKTIYGGGFLLSEKAAAEKAAAEKAAAEKWHLSEKEWEIIHKLGVADHGAC